MTPKVLISDKISKAAIKIFAENKLEVVYAPDLGSNPEELAKEIRKYNGLAIRSATKVTAKVLAHADNLQIIGRAGIGTDNINIEAASKRGIIVMNTPFGNTITTAEHTIALMFAVARQIPAASVSTHAGKWEKSKFLGVELSNKTLGVIGVGNIGKIVCDRARGLKMKILAYDPFLSEDSAAKLQIRKAELDELLTHSDVITLHVPLTEATRNILSRENLQRTKAGVRIINGARGGLVDEDALAELLTSGHIAGVGLDVFAVEPATNNPLFGLPNVVCTPHLGASTVEAQENVAVQVAQQMSDYLNAGAVTNSINMPAISAEEAKIMKPWINLAGHLGKFIGQLTDEPITAINILYDGSVCDLNLGALTCATVAGVMRRNTPDVNMVSAPIAAKEKGIRLSTTQQDKSGAFEGYIKLTMVSDIRTRSIAGTVFSDAKPRFIQIKGINIDAEVGAKMLYTTNKDSHGIIGILGKTLGNNGINIANFTLGRDSEGGEAIALLYTDQAIPPRVVAALEDTGKFGFVRPLEFDVA